MKGKNSGESRIFPAFTPYTLHYTLKQSIERHEKVYIAPQTEAIELLGANAIMAASGSFINVHGESVSGVYGD